MRRAAVWLAALAACARIAAPPGGPPDNRAPILTGTYPESLAVLPDFDDAVEFRFDEVLSQGAQPNFGLGTGDLERLVLLSPTTEVPRVSWHRDRIAVKPREGWQPDRVYRVELLSGVRDLRNNQAKASAVVTFSTGGALPVDSLVGLVVDWTSARPSRGALVEAVLEPDSLVYRTQADSVGRFVLAPLPRGEYLVYGALDANRNNSRDPREAFDSLRIAAGQFAVGELWMFRHDTTGPRLQTVTTTDSVTASLAFAAMLDPYQRFTADSARVRMLPDSTPVDVELLLPQQVLDSLTRARRAAEDSAKAAARPDTARRAVVPDTTPRPVRDTAPPRIVGVPRQVTGARQPARDTTANQPLKTKPPLFDRLMLRVKEPWRDSARYVIEVHGVRTVSGIPGSVRSVLVVPPKRAAAPAPGRGDSTAARPDSLGAIRDTARRDTTAVTARPPARPPVRLP